MTTFEDRDEEHGRYVRSIQMYFRPGEQPTETTWMGLNLVVRRTPFDLPSAMEAFVELLINVIDHFALFKQWLRVTESDGRLIVSARGVKMMEFSVEDDGSVVMWQAKTEELEHAVLGLGVENTNSERVGGFGWGMKDAIRAIVSFGGVVTNVYRQATWTFKAVVPRRAEREDVESAFKANPILTMIREPAVGTVAEEGFMITRISPGGELTTERVLACFGAALRRMMVFHVLPSDDLSISTGRGPSYVKLTNIADICPIPAFTTFMGKLGLDPKLSADKRPMVCTNEASCYYAPRTFNHNLLTTIKGRGFPAARAVQPDDNDDKDVGEQQEDDVPDGGIQVFSNKLRAVDGNFLARAVVLAIGKLRKDDSTRTAVFFNQARPLLGISCQGTSWLLRRGGGTCAVTSALAPMRVHVLSILGFEPRSSIFAFDDPSITKIRHLSRVLKKELVVLKPGAKQEFFDRVTVEGLEQTVDSRPTNSGYRKVEGDVSTIVHYAMNDRVYAPTILDLSDAYSFRHHEKVFLDASEYTTRGDAEHLIKQLFKHADEDEMERLLKVHERFINISTKVENVVEKLAKSVAQFTRDDASSDSSFDSDDDDGDDDEDDDEGEEEDDDEGEEEEEEHEDNAVSYKIPKSATKPFGASIYSGTTIKTKPAPVEEEKDVVAGPTLKYDEKAKLLVSSKYKPSHHFAKDLQMVLELVKKARGIATSDKPTVVPAFSPDAGWVGMYEQERIILRVDPDAFRASDDPNDRQGDLIATLLHEYGHQSSEHHGPKFVAATDAMHARMYAHLLRQLSSASMSSAPVLPPSAPLTSRAASKTPITPASASSSAAMPSPPPASDFRGGAASSSSSSASPAPPAPGKRRLSPLERQRMEKLSKKSR